MQPYTQGAGITGRRSRAALFFPFSKFHTTMEGLMLKLKLQYFGHLMRRTDSLEKTLVLGKYMVFYGQGPLFLPDKTEVGT